MQNIFREVLHAGLIQEISIKRILIDKKSKFQRIQIFDTPIYGRVLALDGIIQITEKDEAAYSEMLVHPAIQILNSPKRVLIIGGGDGAVAEEVLKYKFINRIDLVDIDEEVIKLSKKYFKKINKNSLVHKKVNLYYEDAFKFISNTKKKYDLIIADRPDPVGAGKSLFRQSFYKYVNDILSQDGIAIFQSGVTFLQKSETKEVIKKVKKNFKKYGVLLTVVPSYIGGFMTLVWSSKKIDMMKSKIIKRKLKVKTTYYNEEIRKGSLSSPNFIKSIL
ncbi:MAG: Polyamine aminopropyltransferase [Alphaproteobacteria bacterium MarineAlpha9_Bin4]|nr:spermidine synthase [Pelagibacterales bacterium]PPR25625.1 MAG: Polyamine aminopropyltransferase [Alphaproteobacteria bacterium MarineAlpha9_Bin4]|tara:strand:- start:989 stop:1819 length:831 start_codon:yes stop_codon:yes gene_type:complete